MSEISCVEAAWEWDSDTQSVHRVNVQILYVKYNFFFSKNFVIDLTSVFKNSDEEYFRFRVLSEHS